MSNSGVAEKYSMYEGSVRCAVGMTDCIKDQPFLGCKGDGKDDR